MPPRFAYWTILVGGLPTAFRAAEREEIEPTFKQLQQKHPDAEMRWFARGKLWASPEEAREALERHKAQGARHKEERRDRNWRPGGSHRDPRQPYIDAKKRENQRKRERRFEFKKGPRPPASGFRPADDRPKWDRPKWDRPRAANKPRGARPGNDRPAWDRGPKPPWRDRDERHKAQGTGRKEERKPWEREARHKAQGTGQKEEQKPWQKAGAKWRPPRREGPKTEDRRPKTEAGHSPGHKRWSGPSGGPRKGPGRGRR